MESQLTWLRVLSLSAGIGPKMSQFGCGWTNGYTYKIGSRISGRGFN